MSFAALLLIGEVAFCGCLVGCRREVTRKRNFLVNYPGSALGCCVSHEVVSDTKPFLT